MDEALGGKSWPELMKDVGNSRWYDYYKDRMTVPKDLRATDDLLRQVGARWRQNVPQVGPDFTRKVMERIAAEAKPSVPASWSGPFTTNRALAELPEEMRNYTMRRIMTADPTRFAARGAAQVAPKASAISRLMRVLGLGAKYSPWTIAGSVAYDSLTNPAMANEVDDERAMQARRFGPQPQDSPYQDAGPNWDSPYLQDRPPETTTTTSAPPSSNFLNYLERRKQSEGYE